jgi:endogenous inhibitor of DNA gyrase (YacG/DUF329 family)
MGAPIVKCPTCGRPLEWSEVSPFRPFCSERCRLIDLGAWLSEERGIAGESAAAPPTPPEEEKSEPGSG